MSYQYTYCPACGTRRVAHGYRCTVCDGLVRRVPVSVRLQPSVARTLLNWPAKEEVAAAPAERQPVAA
jgi:hypothetical protein